MHPLFFFSLHHPVAALFLRNLLNNQIKVFSVLKFKPFNVFFIQILIWNGIDKNSGSPFYGFALHQIHKRFHRFKPSQAFDLIQFGFLFRQRQNLVDCRNRIQSGTHQCFVCKCLAGLHIDDRLEVIFDQLFFDQMIQFFFILQQICILKITFSVEFPISAFSSFLYLVHGKVCILNEFRIVIGVVRIPCDPSRHPEPEFLLIWKFQIFFIHF